MEMMSRMQERYEVPQYQMPHYEEYEVEEIPESTSNGLVGDPNVEESAYGGSS